MPDIEPSSPPAAPPVARESGTRRGFLSTQARAVLATVAAVVVFGLAAAPWLLVTPSRLSSWMARAVPELQGDLRIGRARVGWLGPLVLEQVRLEPRDGSRPPLRIERVEVGHGLAGILLSMGDLGRVRLEGLEADIVFDAERNSNIKGLFRPVGQVAAEAPEPPPHARRSPVRLSVEVVGAIVRISGPWSESPWVSDPLHVQARLAPAEHATWSEWRIAPVQLLDHALLEPAVAQGVLAYIAPVMADATRTAGRFSLRIDGATLPVGSPGDGVVAGVLTMHAVDLGPGPLVEQVIRGLPWNLSAPPAVRIAEASRVEFQLADRRVWHKGLEFGVPLAKQGQRLDLQTSGSVGLDDKSLDLKLELPVPADLPADRPVLAAVAGRTFSVRIGGVLGEPRVNFDGSLRANAGDIVGDLLERLRHGKVQPPRGPQGTQPIERPRPSPGPAAATEDPQPDDAGIAVPRNPEDPRDSSSDKRDVTADAVIDLVGGVIGEVAKRRAERKAAEAANPPTAPTPRRGRLLRRILAEPPASAAGNQQPAPPPLQPVPPAAAGK